jgi:starch synthase
MKILFAAAEASPIAKVGGLADVVSSLPRMLNSLGHDVRIIIPKYGCIDESEIGNMDDAGDITVKAFHSEIKSSMKVSKLNCGVIIYLVENEKYFSGGNIYTENDSERFYYFGKAVLAVLSFIDWKPDIVHCHDWHTGLIPMWLKQSKRRIPSVFTIHNLAYQGNFNNDFLLYSGLDSDWKKWPEGYPAPQYNFISHGIVWSDIITTVSRSYAREILESEHGCGLESLLQLYKKKLAGIINGIDTDIYNPASDNSILENYDISTFENKIENKLFLQQTAGFEQSESIPLLGMVTRLVEQKGIDILLDGIESLLEMDIQLFILGKGSAEYEQIIKELASKNRGKLVFYAEINEDFGNQVYAGSDIFLMPSRFEPCGLGQLIAMRYGTIPVVRNTGGIADTVENYDPASETGSGFTFNGYNSEEMIDAIKRAVAVFANKSKWKNLSKSIMQLDNSWRKSAITYEEIYNMLVRSDE